MLDLQASTNLNMSDGKTIADRGEVVWLRKRIKADMSLNDALVLNIFDIQAYRLSGARNTMNFVHVLCPF